MFATLSSPLFLTAWASGTATGLGLFAVVGAQSAFILRQGLMRAHLLSVVAICALIDAVFIFASVSGLQALTAWFPWLTTAVLWFGVAFLSWYGLQSARRAWTATGGLAAARDALGRAAPALTKDERLRCLPIIQFRRWRPSRRDAPRRPPSPAATPIA